MAMSDTQDPGSANSSWYYDPSTGLYYDSATGQASSSPPTDPALNLVAHNDPRGQGDNPAVNNLLAPTPAAPAPASPGLAAPAPSTAGSFSTGYLTGGAPSFTAPGYTKPPAFSYADFVAPDPNDLNKDPNFQYSLKTQQDAIQKSAAARGILNTGGTIYDLLTNANDLASTGYANLYNRDLSTYQTNRQNALDQYNTNYNTQYVDPYKYSYMGAQDAYNSAAHNYDLGQQYNWMNNLFGYQQQQDAFLNKYRLLQIA